MKKKIIQRKIKGNLTNYQISEFGQFCLNLKEVSMSTVYSKLRGKTGYSGLDHKIQRVARKN